MAIVDDRLLLDAPSGAACGSDLAVKIQGHGRTPAESLSPNARSGLSVRTTQRNARSRVGAGDELKASATLGHGGRSHPAARAKRGRSL